MSTRIHRTEAITEPRKRVYIHRCPFRRDSRRQPFGAKPRSSNGSVRRSERLDPEAVVRTQDHVVRNRLITRSYWELSQAMRDLLGEDAGINWCTLATWASCRAGQTIRNEDCSARLASLGSLATLGDLNRERARDAVTEGNLRVYQEIAPLVARFIDCFNELPAPDPVRLAAFLKSIRPGAVTERDAFGQVGQDLLRAAFRHYYLARYTPGNVKQRQEYAFLATAQIALHEQMRLQDVIARAMPSVGWLRRLVTFFMSMGLPQGTAFLAQDVHGVFAPHLRRLENPQTLELLRRFDIGDSTLGSGATDWADLRQRMRYIFTLVRVHHANPLMFQQAEKILSQTPRPLLCESDQPESDRRPEQWAPRSANDGRLVVRQPCLPERRLPCSRTL